MRRPFPLSLAAAVALASASLAGPLMRAALAADEALTSLAGSEWGFAEGSDAFIKFEDGKVSGFSGCNRFIGPYTFADGKITLGPLAGTRMACEPEQMETERQVLDLLAAAKSADATAKALTLKDAAGAHLATLPRRDWD